MMKGFVLGTAAAFMAAVLSAPTARATETALVANYDFFVGGFHIAEVGLNATATPTGYEATSQVTTRGVLEVLLRGRSASKAVGKRGALGRLEPVGFASRYSSRTGEQKTRIGYENATPTRVTFDPQPEEPEKHAKARDQRGSLDPLSAAVAALLPTKSADLCNRTIPIFDGKRRFDIIFLAADPARFSESASPPKWNRPLTRCLGVYERISGFGEESAEDEKYFPFDIWFEDSGNGVFRAVRMAGSTKLGFAIGNLRTE